SDSSDIFTWSRRNKDEFDNWKERTSNSATLNRPDPFGIQDCFLDYSMTKKKRWKIPQEIGERIEDIQDPFRNLRISSSLHTVDHSQNLFLDLYMGNPIVDQPCKSVHDVSRDSIPSTTFGKKGKSRMRDLMTSSDSTSESKRNYLLHIHYFNW
ncbi:hypothetical protein PENTCL1PPCAC_20514, partial [Pristionchus entomophagus]